MPPAAADAAPRLPRTLALRKSFKQETGAILSPVVCLHYFMYQGANMPKIQAETANGLVETEPPAGKKLVLALEDAGIDILHRCGGNARCTTCRVEILEGEPGDMGDLERNRLAMESELAPNVRLSCQIRVSGDLKVHVINQASVCGMDPGPRPFDE